MTKPTGRPRGRPPKHDVTRMDGGYENVFLAVGTRQDRGAYTRHVTPRRLSELELSSLYEGDGFARRVIDIRAEDMTRAGFCIEFDPEDEGRSDAVMAALESVDAMQRITEAVRWSGLFGGSMIVMLVNDGSADLTQPLDITRAKGLDGLRVYDRHRCTRRTYYDDPNDSRMGNVKEWQISPVRGTPYNVHESRCLVFDGQPLPERVREEMDGWGASELQQCYDQVTRLGMSHYWANALLERSQQAVHGMKGLSTILRDPAGQAMVRTRIDLVDMARSINNTVVIDADGESYDLKATSFSGVSDLIDRFSEALCAVTGMPATLLFGRQQKGIGNSGDGDLENWYSAIAQDQNIKLRGPLDRLVQIVLYAMGKYTPNYLIEFEPLKVASRKDDAEVEKLEAETMKLKADTAEVYTTMQALDPSEVRQGLVEEYEIDPVAMDTGPDAEIDGIRGDVAPRTLYVSRKVINVGDLKAWAKKQGISKLQDDLHVTIAYSTTPVDWMLMESPWNDKFDVPAGGPRLVEPLGDRTAVLLFANDDLKWRNMRMRENGASWDYPDYQPHISLTGEPVDLSNVEPYMGPIKLGPEIFKEIEE